jgi:hypothetical protein
VHFFIQVFYFLIFLFRFNYFSENKILYCCGNNDDYQKGHDSDSEIYNPEKIDYFRDIKIENIFSSFRSTFVLSKS